METKKNEPNCETSGNYYGKKLYVLNPAIARVKPPKDQGELFCFEDETECVD